MCIEQALEKLSGGTTTVRNAYRDAIDRIEGQLTGNVLLAKRAIAFILRAKQPLSTAAVCCALSIEPGTKILKSESMHDIRDVLGVCAGLVTVIADTVAFMHYTAQEFIESISHEWLPEAEQQMAVACLSYLSQDAFKEGSEATSLQIATMRKEHAFLPYASVFWPVHVQAVEPKVHEVAFLGNHALCAAAARMYAHSPLAQDLCRAKYAHFYGTTHSTITGLHLAVIWKLHHLLHELLFRTQADAAVNAEDSNGFSPLHLAVLAGDDTATRLLIGHESVDVNKAVCGLKNLHPLNAKFHVSPVTRLEDLLDFSVFPSETDGCWTPLCFSAANGNASITALLLDHKRIIADWHTAEHDTPLLLAARSGCAETFSLLLQQQKAVPRSWTSIKDTLLFALVRLGTGSSFLQAVQIHPFDLDAEDDSGRTLFLLPPKVSGTIS